MDDNNVHIDYEAVIEQLKNNMINKFILSTMCMDKKSKVMMDKLFVAANKNGVSTETLMKILIEANYDPEGFDDVDPC